MNKVIKKTESLLRPILSRINPYFLAIVIIGFTALLCYPLSNTSGYHIVSFILLFVVSILATFLSTGPILLASALSSLVWNFFFIPPHFTFHIEKTEDILMFGMFFIIALLNGVLTTRIRHQELLAREREKRTYALFQLTKELSKASGINEVLTVAIEGIRNHFKSDSFFILQDGNNVLLSFGRLRREIKLSDQEYRIASRVFKNSQVAGKFTEEYPDEKYTFYPLSGTRLNPGVVAIRFEKMLTGGAKVFLDTFLAQVSNALEREFLGELAKKARFLDESDKLYKTLFNSVSHEFRIPVATIMGASDTLLTSSHSVNDQSVLYNEIFTASVRLNRLIENLLNMSRLESGRIKPRLDWYDMNDLINKVADDLKDELKPFSFIVSIPEEMPLVKFDFGLMEQVFYNLLFNSCQHAPAASNIRLKVVLSGENVIIWIMDRGPGFPTEFINKVFDKFFRVDNSKTGGLGLGLSIVKGFVEAHKGTVKVENRKNGGARFEITIPSEFMNQYEPDKEDTFLK